MNDQITGPVGRLLNTISQGVSIRNPLPRAGARFKNEIAKLPLRLAHAAGLKCATVAPGQDEQSRYLSSLSQGEMNPMHVLWQLNDVIGANGEEQSLDHAEIEKLSDFQLYNIYRNMKEHGELVGALEEFVASNNSENDDQDAFLGHVKAMCRVLKETRGTIEGLLSDRKIAVDFEKGAKAHSTERDFILEALENAWKDATGGHDRPSASIGLALRDGLLNRAPEERRKAAEQLSDLADGLSTKGDLDPAILHPLLSDAFRRARVSHPWRKAGEIVEIMGAKQDKRLLADLFGPLQDALLRQLVGARGANKDLLQAIAQIQSSANEGNRIWIPELKKAADRLGVWAAIHELTSYATHRGTEPFDEAVKRVLKDQKFEGEWAQNFKDIARTLDLEDYSAVAREFILMPYEEHSQDGLQSTRAATDRIADEGATQQPERSVLSESITQEVSRGVGEQHQIETVTTELAPTEAPQKPVPANLAAADLMIFENVLMDCTIHFARKRYAGEQPDIEQAIINQLRDAPRQEIILIRDFFLRHTWMSAYFTNGEAREEQLFGQICQWYMVYSTRIALNESHYEPEYWVRRQQSKQDRFEDLVANSIFRDTATLIRYEIANAVLLDMYMPTPIFKNYFEQEQKLLLSGVLEAENMLDFLEMLNEIAEAARASTINIDDQSFRDKVTSILSPAVNELGRAQPLDRLKKKIEGYPSFGNRKPGTLAAKRTIFENADQEQLSHAVEKVDQIAVVANVLRDLLDLGHGGTSAGGLLQLTDYAEKILLKNGDVHPALWELRREEQSRDRGPSRRRFRSPARSQVSRLPTKTASVPAQTQAPLLSPRSINAAESIINDLAPLPSHASGTAVDEPVPEESTDQEVDRVLDALARINPSGSGI
jgi:hypothetical protein